MRTHSTGWLILGEEKDSVQAKLQHYFPKGLQQRYSGPWANFVVAGTPQGAVMHYQALVGAGIQYFVVQMLDAANLQTIRLLAEKVVPASKG